MYPWGTGFSLDKHVLPMGFWGLFDIVFYWGFKIFLFRLCDVIMVIGYGEIVLKNCMLNIYGDVFY